VWRGIQSYLRIFGGLEVGFSYNYLLKVRGRKSGRTHSTPIDLLELKGKRHLLATRGRTQCGVRRDGTLGAWQFDNYNSGPAAIATPYDVAFGWQNSTELKGS